MDHSARRIIPAHAENYAEAPLIYRTELQDIFSVLLRRKCLIGGTILGITLLSALYAFNATPRYTASLQILFNAKEHSVIDFDAAVSDQPQDEAALLSEIEVLKSRALAGRLIHKLGLMNDPEFNDELVPPRLLAKLRGMVGGVLSATRGSASLATPGGVEPLREDRAALERERVIDAVLDRVEVMQSGRSRALEIDFTSTDAIKAAAIANALGGLFLTRRLESKFENAHQAGRWLAEHVETLRQQVVTLETKAEEYRRQHNLLQGERVTLISEQISKLNAQLSDVRRARTEAEVNLAQAQLLLSSPEKLKTAVQVLESNLIQRLREEQTALARQEAALTQEFGTMHPKMRQLRQEQRKLLAEVDAETRKIVASLGNKLNAARRQEVLVVTELEELKAEMAKANDAEVGLHALERDAEAARLMLEKFMSAYIEISAQEDVASRLPDAHIISTAAVPDFPSFPKKSLIVAGGFTFSVLLALLLALTLDSLDSGFRSAEQLERETGLLVMAHVPTIRQSSNGNPADFLLEQPGSAFGESIRSLFTRLLLASQGSPPPQVVLVTSAEPGEGKTSISLALARMQAKTGRRVIFVDTDFRRSVAADLLRFENTPGLSEVMTGEAHLDEALHKDQGTGLDVIVSGMYHAEAVHAFAAGRIENIIETLKARYDFVIIDSAPVLVISDAEILSAMADQTILVVRWGSTRRKVVSFAAQRLRGTARSVGGAVLSQIDVVKQARYNYGDSQYYVDETKRYYLT